MKRQVRSYIKNRKTWPVAAKPRGSWPRKVEANYLRNYRKKHGSRAAFELSSGTLSKGKR